MRTCGQGSCRSRRWPSESCPLTEHLGALSARHSKPIAQEALQNLKRQPMDFRRVAREPIMRFNYLFRIPITAVRGHVPTRMSALPARCEISPKRPLAFLSPAQNLSFPLSNSSRVVFTSPLRLMPFWLSVSLLSASHRPEAQPRESRTYLPRRRSHVRGGVQQAVLCSTAFSRCGALALRMPMSASKQRPFGRRLRLSFHGTPEPRSSLRNEPVKLSPATSAPVPASLEKRNDLKILNQ